MNFQQELLKIKVKRKIEEIRKVIDFLKKPEKSFNLPTSPFFTIHPIRTIHSAMVGTQAALTFFLLLSNPQFLT